MKDIETLLSGSASAKPRRELRADFTDTIINQVAKHPRQRGLARFKETFRMKLFTKPAIVTAAIVFTTTIGGTAYAAVGGWPGVVALFGGQQKLSGGDRIVQIDTQNCNYPTAFNATSKDKKADKIYYRVKADSKLTNDQVVQIVRGNCYATEQANFDQHIINDTLNTNPLNKDRVVGGYIDSVITAISSTSISLESVIPYGHELKTIKQTFNHIADDVLVYSSPNKLKLSDLKAGDHVSIKYRASGDALTHSETIAPDQINTDEQVVVSIIKITPDMSAAVNYQKYNGKEFEQVVPCDGQPTGYCTIEQYYNKK